MKHPHAVLASNDPQAIVLEVMQPAGAVVAEIILRSGFIERRAPRSPSQSHSAGTAGHFMRLLSSHRCKEQNMDREHVKGAADKVKGAIKDTAGKVTGDEKLQSEGKFDKAKGSAHNLAGDVKDAARDASKTADD